MASGGSPAAGIGGWALVKAFLAFAPGPHGRTKPSAANLADREKESGDLDRHHDFRDARRRRPFRLQPAAGAQCADFRDVRASSAGVRSANADKSVKALLIYGAGDKAFAAGTDIAEFRALNSAQDCIDYEIKIERILSAWRAAASPPSPPSPAPAPAAARPSPPAATCGFAASQRQIRLPHRPHARQLPVGRQLRPARPR